jgi:integrase
MTTGHIRPRGPGAWELKYDIGRPVTAKRRIRYKTLRGTKKDAQRELRNLLGAIDQGIHVEPSKITLAELAHERVALWQVSPSTREHYISAAKRLYPIGQILAQRLTTRDIERWHGELRDCGLAPATIRQAHRLLSRVLGEAVRHGLVSRNVAREQPLTKAKRAPKVEIVNAEQIPDLLARLEGDPFHVPVIVALYTGLRRGEQLALRWCDVDLDGASMTIARALEETADGVTVKSTKTESGERVISLPKIVIEALSAHRRQQLELRMALGLGRPSDDALVFPSPQTGEHTSPRSFSVRWLRTVRRLNLPARHWHTLRHTHASMLIAAGVDIVTVSRRLGHASPNVTLGVYSHLFAKDDRAAAAAINAALAGM